MTREGGAEPMTREGGAEPMTREGGAEPYFRGFETKKISADGIEPSTLG
jgi:hypothetical protein